MKQDWRQKSDSQSLLSSSSHQSQNNQLFANYVDPKQQFKFNQSVRSNSNSKAMCQCSKQCEHCLKKSVILEQTLTEMKSKIAELGVKISMSFTKHAQQCNLSGNLQQKVTSMEFMTSQTRDSVRECVRQLVEQKIKQSDDGSVVQRDIDNLYASLRNIEAQQERSVRKQEGSRKKMEERQEDLQDKMQKMVQTMGEMSLLQRKALDGQKKKIELITCSPISKANWHKQSPSFSRETSFDMNRKNLDSTHISYSRNYISK